MLGLHGGVSIATDREKPTTIVRVKTADLAKFLTAGKIKTHEPTPREANDIKEWAATFYKQRGRAPSEAQLREHFPEISRARLRRLVKEFPAEHRRRRGG